MASPHRGGVDISLHMVGIPEYYNIRGNRNVANLPGPSFHYYRWIVYPNVAKVGGLQSQGVKGTAVVIYRKPLTTQDLKFLRLSRRVNNMEKMVVSFDSTICEFLKISFPT